MVLSFLLKPLGASAIKHSDRIFNMMLYYTEGSEFIANPEYVRMEISSLSTAEINDIIASSNLPFPMGREIAKNIAREAFADQGIVTLGDYFNQTIVGVFINILMFLVCFLIIRTILSLVINGADYADPFPMLKSHDGIFGGALGLLRGMLALLLALTLLLAMSATVFAADDTYTITISGDNVVAGHIYEAYQIFKGDLAEKDSKTILSNIEWGSGVNGDALLTALKADATLGNDFKDCTTAAQVADVLATYGSYAGKTQQFAKLAGANLNATVAGTSTWNESGTNYSISSLAPGYYLVKDKDNTLTGANDFYTAYLMKVVANVTATPKGEKPTLEKQIQNNNTGEWSTTGNVAFQLGDTVKFRIITSVPDVSRYPNGYTYIVHDTMTVGFTSKVTTDKTSVSIVNRF